MKNKISIVFLVMIISVISLIGCSKNNSDKYDLALISTNISNTTYADFSFSDLLNHFNSKNKDMFIDNLNISVDKDGYMNSFNIIYYLDHDDHRYTLMYRRNAKFFKISDAYAENQPNQTTNTLDLLALIDLNLKSILPSVSAYESYSIDLISPYEISNSFESGEIYSNGLKVEVDNQAIIKGITFFIYTKPVTLNDDGSFYVFSPQ